MADKRYTMPLVWVSHKRISLLNGILETNDEVCNEGSPACRNCVPIAIAGPSVQQCANCNYKSEDVTCRLVNLTWFRKNEFLVLPKPWLFPFSLKLHAEVFSTLNKISVTKWIGFWLKHFDPMKLSPNKPLSVNLFHFKSCWYFWNYFFKVTANF